MYNSESKNSGSRLRKCQQYFTHQFMAQGSRKAVDLPCHTNDVRAYDSRKEPSNEFNDQSNLRSNLLLNL